MKTVFSDRCMPFFRFPFMVERCMIRTKHQAKVLKSIIIPDLIDMMDNFFIVKESSKMLFQNDNMLKYISILLAGVVFSQNINITSLGLFSPTFPILVMWASITFSFYPINASVFRGDWFFLIPLDCYVDKLLGMFFSPPSRKSFVPGGSPDARSTITLLRTKAFPALYLTRFCIKSLLAVIALDGWHSSSFLISSTVLYDGGL